MENITAALRRIKVLIESTISACKVTMVQQSDRQEAKLTCQIPGAQIKIEVNTVMRGPIF